MWGTAVVMLPKLAKYENVGKELKLDTPVVGSSQHARLSVGAKDNKRIFMLKPYEYL